MDKGNKVAYATLLLIAACAKPNIDNAVKGVVQAMNGISTNLNAALGGGYTLAEAKKCQSESIKVNSLTLPTKAVVNIEITPEVYSLYTEEHAYTDIDPNTLYKVDLKNKTFTHYAQRWYSEWKADINVSLPPLENEKYISKPDYSKVKKKLNFKNPFAIPRSRLGVRLGFGSSLLSERDSSLLLSEGENYAVTCAGALNAYYEALIKTEYTFKD